jgi:hypothetical protein
MIVFDRATIMIDPDDDILRVSLTLYDPFFRLANNR